MLPEIGRNHPAVMDQLRGTSLHADLSLTDDVSVVRDLQWSQLTVSPCRFVFLISMKKNRGNVNRIYVACIAVMRAKSSKPSA